MLNRVCNIILALLLFFVEIKLAVAEKSLVEQDELDNLVVSEVFKDYDIPLYKVSYSKDGKCPTFYVQLKQALPEKNAQDNDIPKIYFEILRVNGYLPYALVDEQKDLKINVGWSNNTPKEIIITRVNARSSSSCLGTTQSSKFIDSIKQDVWVSSKNVSIERSDGDSFKAALFSGTEATKPEDYIYCPQLKQKIATRKYPYHIYLYDHVAGSYWPDRLEVFKNLNVMLTDFSIMYRDPKGKGDLLIAKGIACDGNHYEVYGFTDNHSFIKKFVFSDQGQHDEIYGYLNGNQKNQKRIAIYSYPELGKVKMFYLSPSVTPGEVELKPAAESFKSKTE